MSDSLVDEGYGDMHRIVLQGMMSAGYLDAKGVKSLFIEACKSLKYPEEERTTMAYVQKVVREINDRIKPYDMAIRSASDELNGKKYYVFLISVEKPIMQHQSLFSKPELRLFQKIMDTCLRKYKTFSVPLMECQNMPIEMEMKNFSLSQAEEFIQKMITLLYLTRYYKHEKKVEKAKDGKDSQKKNKESERDFEVTIGIRTIREFEPILRESYEDAITSCHLCKYIMIHGYQCPKCRTNIHKACFQKYIKNTKNCVNSSCRITWKELHMIKRTRDDRGGGGGERDEDSSSSPTPSTSAAAAKKNQQTSSSPKKKSPIASTSAAAKKKQTRQQIIETEEEEDTLQDMPVLKKVTQPTSSAKSKKSSPRKSRLRRNSPAKKRSLRKLSSTEEDDDEEEED